MARTAVLRDRENVTVIPFSERLALCCCITADQFNDCTLWILCSKI